MRWFVKGVRSVGIGSENFGVQYRMTTTFSGIGFVKRLDRMNHRPELFSCKPTYMRF
jgi:hypothetical protein